MTRGSEYDCASFRRMFDQILKFAHIIMQIAVICNIDC